MPVAVRLVPAGLAALAVRQPIDRAGGQFRPGRDRGARALRRAGDVRAPQLPAADRHGSGRLVLELDHLVVAAGGAADHDLRDHDRRGGIGLRGGRRERSAEQHVLLRPQVDGFHGSGVLSARESERRPQPYRRSGRGGDGSVTASSRDPRARRGPRGAIPAPAVARRACPHADRSLDPHPACGRRAGGPCRPGRCAAPSGPRRSSAASVDGAGCPYVFSPTSIAAIRGRRRASSAGRPGRRCRGARPSARRPARAPSGRVTWLSASAVSSIESAPASSRETIA